MTENKILKIPSEIHKIETMCDGGMKVIVYTQELSSESKADLMGMYGKLGVFVFADSDIKVDDLKDLPKVELEEGEKHPSARLRSVLYVYWEQHKVNKPFDSFYREQIEKFIQIIKDKLN